MYKREMDFLDGCIIWGFAAFTFVINTPLSIGFMIGGLVDEQFFTYGMIGTGICGGVSLICIATFVVPLAIDAAQAPARKRAAKEWEERSARQYEEHKRHVKSLYGEKESNREGIQEELPSFEDRINALEDRIQHSFY